MGNNKILISKDTSLYINIGTIISIVGFTIWVTIQYFSLKHSVITLKKDLNNYNNLRIQEIYYMKHNIDIRINDIDTRIKGIYDKIRLDNMRKSMGKLNLGVRE